MALPQMVTLFASAVSSAADRIVAMEKLAISGTDSKKFGDYERFYKALFWRNVIGTFQPESRSHTEFFFRVPISAVLVAGKMNEGYRGEAEQLLMWSYIPTVMAYFTNCRNLVYQAGQVPLRFWSDEGLTISTRGIEEIGLSDGLKGFGASFQIILPFLVTLNRSLT